MDKYFVRICYIHSIILTLLMIISSSILEADIITLKNGREIEVERAYIEGNKVIGIKEGNKLSFLPPEVKEIHKERNSGSVIDSTDTNSEHEITLKDGRTFIVRNFWEENGNIVYEKYGATIKLPGSKIKKITIIQADPNVETVGLNLKKKKKVKTISDGEIREEYMKWGRGGWQEVPPPPGTVWWNPARE